MTDEYLLQAKAEWVLEEIVTAVVQPFVQDSVNAELQEFMNYKEQWVGEEVIDSIARDVVSETYEAAKVTGNDSHYSAQGCCDNSAFCWTAT